MESELELHIPFFLFLGLSVHQLRRWDQEAAQKNRSLLSPGGTHDRSTILPVASTVPPLETLTMVSVWWHFGVFTLLCHMLTLFILCQDSYSRGNK